MSQNLNPCIIIIIIIIIIIYFCKINKYKPIYWFINYSMTLYQLQIWSSAEWDEKMFILSEQERKQMKCLGKFLRNADYPGRSEENHRK
jgi:hypothetical protein